ncbi:MAG: P-II family nitrogen regulator [Bacteroidales bacterium]|nr:P-II family nitrogen regulator [Bacteroidales bacterium]
MKTIMAIIRMDKINETKRALSDIGMPSFMATGRVYGRGKGRYEAKVLEGIKNDIPEAISVMGPEPRLRPQRLVTITVKSDQVKQAVEALIEANRTDSPGDGKIFVLPCTDAVQIRTGLSGDAVI